MSRFFRARTFDIKVGRHLNIMAGYDLHSLGFGGNVDFGPYGLLSAFFLGPFWFAINRFKKEIQ